MKTRNVEDYKKDWIDFDQFKARFQKIPVEEYPNNVLSAIPNPKVSVHIITYQHANYIRQALDSVLVQKTDFPFEVIIGDDESSDGTREICIEYAQKFPDKIRLFLHRRENNILVLDKPSHLFQYTYNSYNLRGKYIAGLSGDDYWDDPTKLQKQYEFLIGNQDYSLCFHGYKEKRGSVLSETINSTFPLPCTIMHLNIFSVLPLEYLQSINEDNFNNQILEFYGKRKFITNISSSVYRVNETSLWNFKNPEKKIDFILLTKTNLYNTFKNTRFKKRLGIALVNIIYSKSKFQPKNRIAFIYKEAGKRKVRKYLIPALWNMLKKKKSQLSSLTTN